MLRPQATLHATRAVVPLSCRRPTAARTVAAALLSSPPAAKILSTTRTDRSKPALSSSSAPSRGTFLAVLASSDRASEFDAPVSVLEPLSYSQAMGGSAGFRVGEGGSMATTTTEKDNKTDSIKSRFARFAARFACLALVMVMVSIISFR